MQILHPFTGSAQQYLEEISTPDRCRPDHCPQCLAKQPLTGHGFYSRTLVDVRLDQSIRVRRYLCRSCKRTVSLLPEFALPYLRFGITVISLFLVARLLEGATLAVAATKAAQAAMPVPARPILGPPLSTASRGPMHRISGIDQAGHSPEFCLPRFADAAIHRLDSGPSVSVLRTALPPVGLARFSRSERSYGRVRSPRAADLRAHTQLLHGIRRFLDLCFWPRRKFPMDAKAEKIALFRYALIASLVIETLPRGELTRRAEAIASRQYEIPGSERTSVSVDTLLNWAVRYRNGGVEALAPRSRRDRGKSRAITPQLADLIERLKRENPHRTGTTLLRELALSSGRNDPSVSASTLYRFLKQRGLTEKQLLAPPPFKKFEAEHSNAMWQSDMLHGPYVQRAGGGKIQAFLHAIIDDASRLIPHAQFYTSQGLDACLDCLRQAIAARGRPVKLYMDNAKIYRGQQLARIAAGIGILVVHTPPYQQS